VQKGKRTQIKKKIRGRKKKGEKRGGEAKPKKTHHSCDSGGRSKRDGQKKKPLTKKSQGTGGGTERRVVAKRRGDLSRDSRADRRPEKRGRNCKKSKARPLPKGGKEGGKKNQSKTTLGARVSASNKSKNRVGTYKRKCHSKPK